MLGCDSIEECLYIPWIPTFCYHDRPSHEARGVGVASLPTLSISDAERRVYHNRRVSDALHRHRIFDTMPMSTHSSPLSARWQARVHSRVVDTAVAAVPEVQQSWVTPGLTSERFNLVKFSTLDTSFGDARL